MNFKQFKQFKQFTPISRVKMSNITGGLGGPASASPNAIGCHPMGAVLTSLPPGLSDCYVDGATEMQGVYNVKCNIEGSDSQTTCKVAFV